MINIFTDKRRYIYVRPLFGALVTNEGYVHIPTINEISMQSLLNRSH